MTGIKKTNTPLELRRQVEGMGWRSLDDQLWGHLDELAKGVVFLAPPLDIVPSPKGNAIYTIIQDLVERAPLPCLILSIWPAQGQPQRCSMSDRILYKSDPFKPMMFEKQLPYRLKKAIWGIGRPELLHYARSAACLCKLLRVKNIVVEDVPLFTLPFDRSKSHNYKIWLHQHSDAPLSLRKPWWKKVEKICSGIIFVAKKTQIDTENNHGKLLNPVVIYNGVDLTHYDPQKFLQEAHHLRVKLGIKKNEIVALYTGRIIPGKGCLELAQAFLRAEVPLSRLILLGGISSSLYSNPAFVNKMNDIVKNSNGKIFSPGNITQADIPGWYTMADFVVVPSIQSEGLPKVVTEALAMGKPVMASDRGGSFELIRPGENGWLIRDPENINKFCDQLRKVLTNKNELLSMGVNALKQDRPRLSIDRTTADFFKFITSESR